MVCVAIPLALDQLKHTDQKRVSAQLDTDVKDLWFGFSISDSDLDTSNTEHFAWSQVAKGIKTPK